MGLNRLIHGLKWKLWQMLDHCPPLEPLPPKILFHASEKVAKLESFIILHFAPRYWPKWNLSLILVAKWLYFKFNLSANQGFNPSFYKISSNCKCGSYSCQYWCVSISLFYENTWWKSKREFSDHKWIKIKRKTWTCLKRHFIIFCWYLLCGFFFSYFHKISRRRFLG